MVETSQESRRVCGWRWRSQDGQENQEQHHTEIVQVREQGREGQEGLGLGLFAVLKGNCLSILFETSLELFQCRLELFQFRLELFQFRPELFQIWAKKLWPQHCSCKQAEQAPAKRGSDWKAAMQELESLGRSPGMCYRGSRPKGGIVAML